MTQSVCEYEKAPGLPMYQAMPSRGSGRRRAAMSLMACSHDTRSNSPPGMRFSGWRTRSASFWTSAMAIPFGHA